MSASAAARVLDGSWHHLAVSYDGVSAGSFFVDGEPDAESPFSYAASSASAPPTATTLSFAWAAPFAESVAFAGELGMARVYDHYLDATAVRALLYGGGAFACGRALGVPSGNVAPPSDDGGLDDFYGSLDEGVCRAACGAPAPGVDDQMRGRGVAPAIGAAGSHDALHPFSLGSRPRSRAGPRAWT